MSAVPGGEQVVENRVKLLFGGVPGLVEVVVDACGVDGADGGFGVGVGGEQDALGVREHGDGALEEVDAGHAGHALVGKEESDGFFAFEELSAHVERGLTGSGAQDAVLLAILPAQILDDGFEYADVVVDCEKNWFCHGRIISRLTRSCLFDECRKRFGAGIAVCLAGAVRNGDKEMGHVVSAPMRGVRAGQEIRAARRR